MNTTLLTRERKFIRGTYARTLPVIYGLLPGVILGSIGLAQISAISVRIVVYGLILPLTILQLLGVRRRADLDEGVIEALVLAGLWDEVQDRIDAPGISLSGGQPQRLSIARALATQPEVLLLDEPCSALDPIATAKIESLLQHLKGRFTLVIVTHNLAQAHRVADRTAFFYLGKLVEVDHTLTIFGSPREKLTEDYVNGRFGYPRPRCRGPSDTEVLGM